MFNVGFDAILYNCCSLYNLNKEISKDIADECFDIINQVKDTNTARDIVEVTKILINLRDDIPIDHIKASYLLTILHKGAGRFSSIKPDSDGEQVMLSAATSLIPFLDLSSKDKEKLRQIHHLMIAQAWEKSGDIRLNKGDPERAMIDYEAASKEYSLAFEEINRLSREVLIKTKDVVQGLGYD